MRVAIGQKQCNSCNYHIVRVQRCNSKAPGLCINFLLISLLTLFICNPSYSFLLPKHQTIHIQDYQQKDFSSVYLIPNNLNNHYDNAATTSKCLLGDGSKQPMISWIKRMRKYSVPQPQQLQQDDKSKRFVPTKMILFLTISFVLLLMRTSIYISPVNAIATLSPSTSTQGVSATGLSNTLGVHHVTKAAILVLVTTGLGLSILSNVPIVSRDIIKACLRSSIQLFVFGSTILTQLFIMGQTRSWLVWGWISFTALIAANEAYNRVEYTYPQLPYHLILAFILGGGLVIGSTVVLRILGPVQPWYTPRVWIPVAGMMLGNALSGTALAAKAVTKELATNSDQIELRLSQGASWREAMQVPIQTIYSSSLTPLMNFLSAAGIVHVPGLMTGQILAGQSPVQAATYQLIVFMLMASTTCTSVQFLIRFAISTLVDQRNDRLKLGALQRIIKPIGKKRNNIIGFLSIVPQFTVRAQLRLRKILFRRGSSNRRYTKRAIDGSKESVNGSQLQLPYYPQMPVYSVVLNRKLADESQLPSILSVHRMRVARTNMDVTFDVKGYDRIALTGKSGIGKSQVLRTLIGLEMVDRNSILLQNSTAAQMSMAEWRSRIVLVPQKRPTLEGTPNDFYKQVIQYKSQSSKRKDLKNVPFVSPVEYCKSWGIPVSMLDRPWSKLSGGESQRIVLAIALALRPDVLLLDESTSALDEATEILVEATLKQLGIPIILVSHSGSQVERFCNQRLNLEQSGSQEVKESKIMTPK